MSTMATPTPQTIINAFQEIVHGDLSHLEIDDDGIDDRDQEDMEGWSERELREEVMRLRGEVRDLKAQLEVARIGVKGKRKNIGTAEGRKRKSEEGVRGEKRLKIERSEETGKRVERARKTELGHAIRAKVSECLSYTSYHPQICAMTLRVESPTPVTVKMSNGIS
jgi:hypothetical protein